MASPVGSQCWCHGLAFLDWRAGVFQGLPWLHQQGYALKYSVKKEEGKQKGHDSLL